MKPPQEWTEEDLQQLIVSKRQESIDLDYKESESLQNTDGKKNEISKDVSAFANSAGGTIIYGIKEDAMGQFPEGLDAGSDPGKISKEWLEQVISSRIQRRIDGVRINPVWLVKTNPGRVAYVVSIPQSDRAPHQAYDKKFYKRFNFQSVPMEEFEIRDVARRSESPDLRVVFGIGYPLPDATEVGLQPMDVKTFHLHLGFSINNESTEPAYYCICQFWISSHLRLAEPHRSPLNDRGSGVLEVNGQAHMVNKYSFIWMAEQKGPLLYSVPMYMNIVSQIRRADAGYFFHWKVNAPRMNEKSGTTMLSVTNGRAVLSPVLDTVFART